MLTILSADGKHRAIVSETDNGVAVAYFRLRCNNAGDAAEWGYQRTSIMPQPFHVALDIAHAVIGGQ